MGLDKLYNKSKKQHKKNWHHLEGEEHIFEFDGNEKAPEYDGVDILANEVQMRIDLESEKEKKESEVQPKQKLSKVELQRQRAKEEEERYDQLLSSVQAQNLIKTVDKIKTEKKEQPKAEAKQLTKTLAKTLTNPSTNPSTMQESMPEPKPVSVHRSEFYSEPESDFGQEDYYINNLDDDNDDEQESQFASKIAETDASMDVVDVNLFRRDDLKKYIMGQCEVMEEATTHVDEAMEEYSDVTEYFTDIQKIEQAPDHIRENIENSARRVNDLSVDRRISKVNEVKLSTSAYHRMEKLENEIPRGFQYLQKQESYYETVRRDMRILEGEQLGFRLEAKMLTKRQLKIKTFSIAAIIGLVIAFIIFIIALSFVKEDDYALFYIAVALIGAIIALGLFALQKYTERQVLLTEIKLNKAASLLNKTKIKYINAANTLDYEYSKYHVKSSYELEKKYQAYVEMKEDQRKALSMTTILNEAEQELEKALQSLDLYDTHIWIGQVKALFNPKEMVEVRHELTTQRQKLRNLIEYNEKKIEEAKRNIKAISVKYPEYTQTAVGIIQEYEQKKRNNRSK